MTTPAHGPVTAFDDTVDVEYSRFCLQDMVRMDGALSLRPPEDDDWLIVGGPGGVLFRSAGSDHNPPIRLELWAVRPEPPETRWRESAEAVFTSAGTELRLWSVTAALGERTLVLPGPGDYHVEAFVRGEADPDEEPEDEEWLVRIWPA
ncbi:hypothetical protein AB0K14_26115 [Actinosynnema sp. NPDC050801]|uniref:hypothetical protein n=1 Tax=unclassified Actinosynnema TaxID=2637065 RepID=UPI0033E4B5B5